MRRIHRELLAMRDLPHGLDAGGEEIVAAARDDEGRQSRHRRHRAALQEGIARSAEIGAGHGTTTEAGLTQDLPPVEPVGLYDLELQVQTRVGGDEQQAALAAVARRIHRQQGAAIGHAAAQDAMAAHIIGPADVARIGSPDMRPEGATQPLRIIRSEAEIVEKPVRIASQIPWCIRRHGQRSAVRPASDELRGELVLGSAVVWPLACQIRAKRRDVLFELAKDQESTAVAQRLVNRKMVLVAILILLTEVDLAVGDRRPGAVGGRRAAARQGIAEVHVDERLAYAVAKAEMLHAIRRADDPSVPVDLVGIFAELDMLDFDTQRHAQQRQDGAQRIAPAVGAGAVVEGAYIVTQPPAKSLRDRLIVVGEIAAGEVT